MVAHTFHRLSGLRITLLVSAILFFILALGSCQFLGMDMFPSTLSRAEAVLDLKAELVDLGVTGEYKVTSMTFLTSPATGKKYIFVRVATYSAPPRLLILDAEDLSVVKVLQYSVIGDLIFIDMENYFVTGNQINHLRINATTLEAGNIEAPSFQLYSQGFTKGPTSWLVWYDSMTFSLHYSPYTAAWGGGIQASQVLDSMSHSDWSLQSLYYEGSTIRLFFNSINKGPTHIVSFQNTTDFISAFSSPNIFAYTGTTVVTIPSGDDQSGWLTRNGAIILTHDNQTRLVRYESDSGKELDSFVLNDTENTRFTFSPDGKKWLMYDGRTGKLHLLRTWW